MNRSILIQITAPAIIIGMFLFGACIFSAWHVNRLQTNMANILSQNVASLRAAEQLEINLRQLRFHCFLYLIDPSDTLREEIHQDDQRFEEWLERARGASNTPQEDATIRAIEEGYDRYQEDFQKEMKKPGPRDDFQKIAGANPVSHIVEPCRELLRLNEEMMEQTSQGSERLSRILGLTMLFLGLVGPLSGLVIGFGMARGLSQSIYRISVRVQDMAQHLEKEVGSVKLVADGDLQHLDEQLQHVVQRVAKVTERLQRQQSEMLRAQQLSAVGQLAASVAHEVRNPLTSIKMLVEAALRHHNPRPFTRDNLQVIHGEILRLEQTVRSFLDFARPPALERQVSDLRAVTSQAVDLVRARGRQQRVAIDLRFPDEPVLGHVDRAQLITVLVNLFINACDAMPAGGRLAVTLEQSTAAAIRLAVVDTGTGIPPEMVDQLFTPFTSTKPTGCGLGLSISRRIIEEHKGSIAAANGPAGGACFTITLPASVSEECHADSAGH